MGFEPKMMGKRIADVRNKNNISQEKIAESLNKSVSLISLYEAGRRVPPPDVLFEIADLFDISVDYLIGLTDNPDRRGNLPPDYEKLKAIEAALEKIDLKALTEIDKLMKE
jgi:transcriptional regulator with XRE-family HTH domain